MDKEKLKKVVLEILNTENEESFSVFLKNIAENLQGNKTLKLDGIGHFQLRKEPLSRMERRGEESEKEILIFLPEGESSEEKLLSFEIENSVESIDEFNDSVFDIGVNKPTIISDSEDNNEVNESKILEFIESGSILEEFNILSNQTIPTFSGETKITEDEEVADTKEDVIVNEFDNPFLDDDVTEVHINENFLNDSSEEKISGGKNLNETVNTIDKKDFEEVSSNAETKITEDDVTESENGIINIEDTTNKDEDEKNIDESIDEIDEDKNPFDELDDYIKEDSKDEAQEILDEEPDEEVENLIKEKIQNSDTSSEKKDSKRASYSALRNKSNEWYKNPILFIAILAAVIAVVVILFFWPTSDEVTEEQSGETIEINSTSDNVEQSKIDSAYALTSAKSTAVSETKIKQTDDEKLLEVKKVESISKPVKDIKKESSKSNPTGLYRDIPNDQTVTQRIYTDGVQFTVQSSSWKSTSIAEREVSKLRKRGFDAFIFKVFIKSKGSTWNRVRVGYFNTRKEAEEFLRKNKI